MIFLNYFQKIFLHYPNPILYLKGGAVLNIKVFQDTNYLSEIKDFDFVLEDERFCNEYFYSEFSEEFDIFLNGCRKPSQGKNTQLHVMRHHSSTKYELSVCVKDCLELPMTSMKILVTKENYVSLLNSLENDHSLLIKLDIIIPNHNDHGMFAISFNSDDSIISNIIINTTINTVEQQCLYYLIKNPTNIARLKFKNIPKSQNIRKLYRPTWLLNESLILNLVEKLIVNITLYVNDIYERYEDDINILTEQIIKDDDQMMIYECTYDLLGIGSDPSDVIDYLYGKNDDPIIRNSPRIIKLQNKELMIDIVKKIEIKCQKYDVKFNLDMLNSNPCILKNKTQINRDLLRTDLTNIYIEMFQKIDHIFENLNMNRWKGSFDLSDPLVDIFKFCYKLKLKINEGPIVINSKILSTRVSWLIVNKIQKF